MWKLRLVWNILRGRPVAYRLVFDGHKGLVCDGREKVMECYFTNLPIAISIPGNPWARQQPKP